MMTTFYSLNQGEIAKAWFTYIKHGVIREDILRPIIASSWKRSPKLDYYSMKPIKKTPSKRQHLLYSQNYDLIELSKPMMEYLFALDNKIIIVLCDKNGYCLHFIHNYGNEITAVDTCYAEDQNGCNIVGVILKEQVPAVVSGFENLRTNWSSLTSGGVPLKDSYGNLQGILGVGYPFNKVPNFSLDLIQAAGSVVEECLASNSTEGLENKPLFDHFINLVPRGLLIIEKSGRLINANNELLDKMDIRNKSSFIGEPLSKYIDNKSVSRLLSQNILDPLKNIFSLIIEGESTQLQVHSLRTISHNDSDLVLISLEDIEPSTPSQPNQAVFFKPIKKNTKKALKNIIGESSRISELKRNINKVSKLSSTILIQGESGTGKELIASTIHAASGRKGPFVPVNCGAIPKDLLESELFGYEEGAFTGAKKKGNVGKFEAADGGTLFLDEIGEMPLNMQVALLRFLEDKNVIRMGSTKSFEIDARIIAATNRDLMEAVANKSFRQDLFYRLNVINFTLPPLRNIKDDIPLMVNHFISKICQQYKVPLFSVSEEAMHLLSNYDWPGNARELRNTMERAVIYAESSIVSEEVVHECLGVQSSEGLPEHSETEISEYTRMIEMLEMNNWNFSQTARFMGISRKSLYSKVNSLGISLERSR